MVSLTSLWMPILLSAVAVFIVSSVIHMVLAYHRSDHAKLPSEDAVMDALRPFNIPPGDYMMPCSSGPAEMKSPAFLEKFNKGPVAVMTVLPTGQWRMGAQLAQWFVYLLVVGTIAAYVASRAVTPGAPYLEVFRFVGTTAFAAYGLALWQNSIWYKKKWSATIKSTFDALLYGLVTAGVFGWLWPN
jgi:hypothetical protein